MPLILSVSRGLGNILQTCDDLYQSSGIADLDGPSRLDTRQVLRRAAITQQMAVFVKSYELLRAV
jgi:hypothetical protein